MLRKSLLAITILASFAAAGAASALGPDNTLVAGDVDITVTTHGEVTTETAFAAPAETDIGTINDGSWILGDADIYVHVHDVKTKSAAFGKACTSIGSVGGCKNQ
jgi:hypothetical protein